MSQVPHILNGETAAQYGCIVTFENEQGDRISGHRAGPPLEGLRELCAAAVVLDPTYRVICYSTPQSVYASLYGRMTGGQPNRGSQRPYNTESHVLTKAGLRHMLHPRLASKVRGTTNEKHARELEW